MLDPLPHLLELYSVMHNAAREAYLRLHLLVGLSIME
jgi:hypothetical protein